MAIYHLNAKMISRSAGRSATAAAAYRAAVKIKDERTGKVFDYRRKREVSYSRVYAPKNSPIWATARDRLWNEAEFAEKRKDAQVAREVEVALPIELTEKQQIILLERFIQTQFVKLGMVADVAIHSKKGNPHAHILLTTRSINSNGFGQKNRDWNSTEQLETWREQWAVHCNRRLFIAGRKARIDHRTLKEQGVDKVPTVHVGPTSKAMQERGIPSARAELNSTIKENTYGSDKKRTGSSYDRCAEHQRCDALSVPASGMERNLFQASAGQWGYSHGGGDPQSYGGSQKIAEPNQHAVYTAGCNPEPRGRGGFGWVPPKNHGQTINEQIRVLGMQLLECEPWSSEAAAIMAQINALVGQREELPKGPKYG